MSKWISFHNEIEVFESTEHVLYYAILGVWRKAHYFLNSILEGLRLLAYS